MKEYFLKIKEWWSSLAPREKRMVGGGGFILLIFLIYQFLLSPLYASVDTLRKRVVMQKRDLAWMYAADKAMRGKIIAVHGQAITALDLLGVIQQQAKDLELLDHLKQLKQVGDEGVSIEFQKAQFDQVSQLLMNLTQSYRLVITQMTASAADEPGTANVKVVIKTV